MPHEQFERWLSDWLCDPADVGLRARIDAAMQADPALRTLARRWCTVQALTQSLPREEQLNWATLAARTAQAVRAVEPLPRADARLDQALANLAELPPVDWQRLVTRISAAVAHDATARRARHWRGIGTIGAVAAALALMLVWQAAPQPQNSGQPRGTPLARGVALARVEADPAPLAATGVSFARIEPLADLPLAAGAADDADASEEIFLIISPAAADASAGL